MPNRHDPDYDDVGWGELALASAFLLVVAVVAGLVIGACSVFLAPAPERELVLSVVPQYRLRPGYVHFSAEIKGHINWCPGQVKIEYGDGEAHTQFITDCGDRGPWGPDSPRFFRCGAYKPRVVVWEKGYDDEPIHERAYTLRVCP